MCLLIWHVRQPEVQINMKQFISFVIKEGRHILRDKRTMLILFGMPVVMMLLFGFAISTDVKNVRTIVVISSIDHQTQSIIEALDASEYFDILYNVNTPQEAERLIRNQKADMAIVFSPDFASKHEGLQIITDGADPNMAQLYSNYATQILSSHIGLPGMGSSSIVNSKLLYNPQMKSAYNFVPGIMGMLLMLICAMMTSISIVREKERGTMEVLLVSPIRPLIDYHCKGSTLSDTGFRHPDHHFADVQIYFGCAFGRKLVLDSRYIGHLYPFGFVAGIVD
jgi:ABC-2 type transport system permease protein